mmetsp:Transcript_1762/g.7679  ORF Transcript_1762/g.7679 Transcript_1762/m.7679 type:complete len:87 (-) Transcript_1762:369-629(-)
MASSDGLVGKVRARAKLTPPRSGCLLTFSCSLRLLKFTSNIDRLGYALMYGLAGGCYKPYVSIEGTWCFDFGQMEGIGVGGRKYFC